MDVALLGMDVLELALGKRLQGTFDLLGMSGCVRSLIRIVRNSSAV